MVKDHTLTIFFGTLTLVTLGLFISSVIEALVDGSAVPDDAQERPPLLVLPHAGKLASILRLWFQILRLLVQTSSPGKKVSGNLICLPSSQESVLSSLNHGLLIYNAWVLMSTCVQVALGAVLGVALSLLS